LRGCTSSHRTLACAASKGLPDDYEQKTWEKLQAAIAAVQNKQAVQYGEEELYKVSNPLSSSISRSSVDLVFGDEYP
jgi:hypothetical protein